MSSESRRPDLDEGVKMGIFSSSGDRGFVPVYTSGFNYEFPRIVIYYGVLSKRMSEGALASYLRALAAEVTLHVIIAWARDHYLHRKFLCYIIG